MMANTLMKYINDFLYSTVGLGLTFTKQPPTLPIILTKKFQISFICLYPSTTTWSRDHPRKSPRAPPIPLTRSSKPNTKISSWIVTRVFSGLRKKAEDQLTFQFIFSSLTWHKINRCHLWRLEKKSVEGVNENLTWEKIYLLYRHLPWHPVVLVNSVQLYKLRLDRMSMYRRISGKDLHGG